MATRCGGRWRRELVPAGLGVLIPPALGAPARRSGVCRQVSCHMCALQAWGWEFACENPGSSVAGDSRVGGWLSYDDYFCAPRPRPLGCSLLTGLDGV